MIQKLKLLITITAFTFIISGCKDEIETWHDHQYVFLEHHKNTYGTLLKGDIMGYMMMDFPFYLFDESTGILRDLTGIKMNKSLSIVLGDGESIGGSIGDGAGTWLYEIRDFPYKKDSLTVENVFPDGTVNLIYKDSMIVLKSNEEWIKKTETMESYIEGTDTLSIQKITVTDRIVNYGLLEKSNFINGLE